MAHWWGRGARALAGTLAGGAVLVTCWCGAAAGATVTEFSAGIPGGAGPNGIATGASGSMWFSEYDADQIARVASNGAVTQFPSSGPGLTAGAHPSGVVMAPDGKVWFTEFGTGDLGELDPATGRLVGEYPLPSGAASGPEGIVVGPDGALWFAENGAGQVGRLDLAAASAGTSNGITEYPLGTSVPDRISTDPVDLVVGPDDALWVTLAGTAAVDRVDTSAVAQGTLNGVTDYPLPATNSAPEGITSQAGTLWIADYGAGDFASVDPSSVSPGTSNGINEVATSGTPLWISNAADGALWATDNTNQQLLRFDTSNDTTTVFGSGQGVTGDATGAAQDDAGTVWFTEFNADKVGEVTFAPGPAVPLNTVLPAISGSAVGTTVTCTTGTWTQNPTGYTYRWLLNGQPIAGQTAATYTIGLFDSGQRLTCQVTATNAAGSTSAISGSVTPFVPPSETLTITTSGSGTGLVSGSATCLKRRSPPSTCQASFPYGTVVTLTASPGRGSTFLGWLSAGNAGCVLGTCTIAMTAAESVTAFFETPQILTTQLIGDGQGYVTDAPPSRHKLGGSNQSICTKPPQADLTCTKRYAFGSELALRAVATSGSRFIGWSGACSGTGTCGVFMDGARNVSATFTYDAGVHVNGIEISQGVQTTELPTRTTPAGYYVSYQGVPISSTISGSAPVTVELAQDHATVVRVYVNTQRPRLGQPVPTMRLSAYRNGQLLAPGPIGPDKPPPLRPTSSGGLTAGVYVPVGPLGAVSAAQHYSAIGAYTFTLPWGWAEGHVTFIADTNPAPGTFPNGCLDTSCLDRGIELGNQDFHPVTFAQIDPIAITYNGRGPKGFSRLPGARVDPSLLPVQDVVPFPIYVAPYVSVVSGDTALGCDGVTQGTLTAGQFKQAVYQAQNTALLQYVTSWASKSKQNMSTSIIPYGLLSPVASTNCAGSLGNFSFSGGVSNGNVLYSANQPQSLSSDDRPITGIAHEFHHDIGLPHAGQQCGSGSVGAAKTYTGTHDVGQRHADALLDVGIGGGPADHRPRPAGRRRDPVGRLRLGHHDR